MVAAQPRGEGAPERAHAPLRLTGTAMDLIQPDPRTPLKPAPPPIIANQASELHTSEALPDPDPSRDRVPEAG